MAGNLRAVLFALGLLAAVYLPAFAAASVIRPPIKLAIPLVIGISFCVAMTFVFFLARRGPGFAAFGIAMPQRGDLPAGLLLGFPLALAVTWLTRVFPSKQPFDTSSFPAWMHYAKSC